MGGFTLVELLVVISIVLMVSAVAIAGVIYSSRERAVISGADLLLAAITGARDAAASSGSPRGIRLLPDPAITPGGPDPARAWAADRWVELATPPPYSAGRCSVYPAASYPAEVTGGRTCLVLEEAPGEWQRTADSSWVYMPIEPTNWWGLVRLGERVRIGAGEYAVCGPYATPNGEALTNAGAFGDPSPLSRTYTAPDKVTQAIASPQYLLLTNRLDDDGDGFPDEGWDGIDNDLANGVDDLAEWERETWGRGVGKGGEGLAYSILRRPAPTGQVHSLGGAVVDLTTWATTRERSRIPVDQVLGTANVVVDSSGRLVPDLPFGVPSSLGLGDGAVHLWIAGRGDLRDPGLPSVADVCVLPVPGSGQLGAARVVSVSRSGRSAAWEPRDGDPARPSAIFADWDRGRP